MRFRALLPAIVLALALPLGLLAGCGGDDEPKPATGPGLPSQAELKSYFEAITSGDPDRLEKARTDIAAPGSLAEAYAAYIGKSAVAAAAAGQEASSAEVQEVDGGFKACIAEDRCATWSDLEGKDGRLADFAVNGSALDDSLVDLTGQPPIESPGLYRVQPDYAYRLPSGVLNVVVTVTAQDAALAPKPGIYVESDTILKGAKGDSPVTIAAGTSSPVVLSFPKAQDAKLDGQITFDLGIEGAGAESIGFGLTSPAP